MDENGAIKARQYASEIATDILMEYGYDFFHNAGNS